MSLPASPTGTPADFARRLRLVLPDRWFPDNSPILAAVLTALGANWADLYGQLQFTAQQARLQTVSGAWLDMAALDFRGLRLQRKAGESDTAFRARLLPIFRDKATRAALIARILDLTGNVPTIFEPSLPSDINGGYGTSMGYGAAGHFYGSIVNPNQVFIKVARPAGQGVANAAGYGHAPGGYRTGRSEYASLDLSGPHVTDQDIYDAIVDVLPVGTIGWVALSGATASGGSAALGSFFFGVNELT